VTSIGRIVGILHRRHPATLCKRLLSRASALVAGLMAAPGVLLPAPTPGSIG
jgi:hypothetical protein